MHVRHLLLFAALAPALALAQEAQNAGDPPNRVARVSLLEGNVSLEPAGVDRFSAAEINYPLTAGDRIYADNEALTELQTSGLALRLGNGADLTVTTLTDFTAQFGLAQGSLRLRTRDLDAPPSDGQAQQAVVEIDTANGAILIERPGDIRVDSYPQDDTTIVTVTTGQVAVTGNGVDQVLYPGQALRLAGNPTYAEAVQPLSPDPLDRFDFERERARQQSLAVSAQYVDSDMIGVADLAQYGDWDPNAAGPDAESYGAVWFPRFVPSGWTPYSNGHWAWVVPWGWTWVEAEPWGFAPFHYGRWAQFGGPGGGGRWGWIPGPPPSVFATGGRPFHPVYSPALVAFVGGPSFSISLGFGGISGGGVTAWFPLGPREAFVPWYHASPGYVNRVNVTNIYNRNVTEVHNTYINRTTTVYNMTVNNTYVNRTQATVAVPQHDFAAGRSVAQSQPIRFNPAQRQALTSAPILPHPLVTPAASIAAPQAPARVVPPSAARPVLENRGGNGFRPGNAPANLHPVNPGSPVRVDAPPPAPGQPAPGQTAPGQPRPYPANPGQPRAGQPAPAQPRAGQLAPSPNPGQPSPNQPGPTQPGGSRPVTGTPQPAPIARQTPAAEPAPGRLPQQAAPDPVSPSRPTAPGRPVTSGQPNYPGQTTRGSFPVQRAPQPAPAAPAPVAAPARGATTPAPTALPPTLQARPVPRPVDQPRALVNRTEPTPPPPSFIQQQKAIQRADPGRPLGPQQLDNVRNNRPAGPPLQPEPAAHPAPAARPAPAGKPATPPPAPGKPAPGSPVPSNPAPGRVPQA